MTTPNRPKSLVAVVTAGALALGSVAAVASWDRTSPARPAAAESTASYGPKAPPSTRATLERNKRIVRDFNRLAFREGLDEEALKLVGDTYTNYEAQGATTDRQTLVGFLGQIGADPEFVLDDVIAERDMVTVRYEVVSFGTPTIGIDIYRVVNGKIVEHWDAFAAPTATTGNP